MEKISKNKIYKTIGHQLGIDPESLKPDMELISDLNIAPIDLVDLISTLEEQFKIDIPTEDVRTLKTLGDLEMLISELVNEI